jgi:hypothetical protein
LPDKSIRNELKKAWVSFYLARTSLGFSTFSSNAKTVTIIFLRNTFQVTYSMIICRRSHNLSQHIDLILIQIVKLYFFLDKTNFSARFFFFPRRNRTNNSTEFLKPSFSYFTTEITSRLTSRTFCSLSLTTLRS